MGFITRSAWSPGEGASIRSLGGHLVQWYIDALRKYAVFSGRARRKEYWMYTLFSCLIYAALLVLAFTSDVMAVLAALFGVASIVPTLSVTVRRLHDTGKSGWVFLIGFIPLIGAVILLVFTCTEGNMGRNVYGLDPKDGGFPPYSPQFQH